MSERELQNNSNDRRSFIKLLVAAPLFANIGARSFAATVAAATKTATLKGSFSDNIYTSLGVRPLINCRGPWTYLTASLELPEVRAAADAASHYFVDLFELQAAAGRYLAKLSGAESGMVTSGSAGAIACATAGCIAGSDPKNIYQLPDTTGMKGEVIILGGRTPWDSCIRLTGAKLVVVPTVNDLSAALTSQTAMVYTTWGETEVIQSILKITKPAGVPVMVDQASSIPPFSNFTRLAKTGVDLFCFSGGKGMRGPQVSGVLLGRKDLIDAALYNTNPWEGSICRPMKVSKEDMMGCLAAVEYWAKADEPAINKAWQRQVERMNIDGAPTLAAARAAHMTANLPTLNFEMRQYPCGCSATGNGIQPLPDCCPNHYDAPYNNMNSSFEGSPGDGMPKVSSTRQSARALATMELSHKVIDILTPPVPTIYKEAFGTAESPDPVFYACRPDGCTLAHLHRPGIRCGVCGETPDGFSEPVRKL